MRRPINPKAIDAVEGLNRAYPAWGKNKTSVFAAKFIETARKYKINPGRLAERTLRRSPDDVRKMLAIMKQLTFKGK